jgi:hypothetical protein
MNNSYDHDEACSAVILADDIAADRSVLEQLKATPDINFIDQQGRSEVDHVCSANRLPPPWR